jgi:hypothetical protein
MKRFFAAAAILVLLLSTAFLYLRASGSTLSQKDLGLPRLVPGLPIIRPSEEQDIYEAVFQYRIQQYGTNHMFFLSIDGKDPDDEFIARFDHVKKASGSYFAKEPFPGWLRDRVTGKKTRLFWAGPARWLSQSLVEVKGGSYCGGLCADAGTYRVHKQNGRWVVESYKVEVVA